MPLHCYMLLCWLAIVSILANSIHGFHILAETPSIFVAADPNDPKYVITIDTKAPPEFGGDMTIMTRKDGRRFSCAGPQAIGSSSSQSAVANQDAASEQPLKTPTELLDALEGMCLYRQDGLWTYEMCYKQHVRQLRQGQSKEEHTCGVYKEAVDEVEVEEESKMREDHHTVGAPLRYIRHVMKDGGECLLTGQPRSAEVRFTCQEDGGQNVVTSIREFPTCNYVVTVHTPFLCAHPLFRQQAINVQMVNCWPEEDVAMAPPGALPKSGSESESEAAAEAEAQREQQDLDYSEIDVDEDGTGAEEAEVHEEL